MSKNNNQSVFGDVSFSYWNDANEERKKSNFARYLKEDRVDVLTSSHREIYDHCLALISQNNLSTSRVLSLACGTCWLESLLAKQFSIAQFTGIDFSGPRIRQNAKLAMSRTGISDISLLEQDVYEFSTETKFDLVLMSQAFHHMDSPVYLLKRLRSMLNSNGCVLIVGEHRFDGTKILRNLMSHYAKYLLNWRDYRNKTFIFPGYGDLFAPDLVKGDNHYHAKDYSVMFARSGFELISSINNGGEQTKSFLIAPSKTIKV